MLGGGGNVDGACCEVDFSRKLKILESFKGTTRRATTGKSCQIKAALRYLVRRDLLYPHGGAFCRVYGSFTTRLFIKNMYTQVCGIGEVYVDGGCCEIDINYLRNFEL